jgi:hypothetical protein
MINPDHDLGLMMAGIYISKFLSILSPEEALTSLYNTAIEQEDYEVCSIIKEVLRTMAK